MEINEKILRDLKKKFEVEASKREIEAVDYWKKELEVIYKKKYENLSSMQVELRGLMDRMGNRIGILTRMVREES